MDVVGVICQDPIRALWAVAVLMVERQTACVGATCAPTCGRSSAGWCGCVCGDAVRRRKRLRVDASGRSWIAPIAPIVRIGWTDGSGESCCGVRLALGCALCRVFACGYSSACRLLLPTVADSALTPSPNRPLQSACPSCSTFLPRSSLNAHPIYHTELSLRYCVRHLTSLASLTIQRFPHGWTRQTGARIAAAGV